MKKNILGYNFLLLIILSSIWGSAFLAIKISVESINPVTVASGRLLIGAFFLYIFYKYKKIQFTPNKKIILYFFLIGLIGNFIPFFLISWSEVYIQSNTAGLLLSVAPIFALLIAHYFTKDDKFSLKKLMAVFIGFIGVIFIFGLESLIALFSNNFVLIFPKIAIIIAALGYVISSIMAYNIKDINIITLTTFVTICAAIISVPFMLYVELQNPSMPIGKSMISLLYLGIFPTALAFLLRFYIILKAGPIFLSYVAYLIPVFAIFWGFVFLGEKISVSIVIGLLFILTGTFIGQQTTSAKNN